MEKQSITESIIYSKIGEKLTPSVLKVENESHMHGGPARDSHFKVTVVSEYFTDLSRVKRHQYVYKLLTEELNTGVHALALHLYSQQEWEERHHNSPDSPDCLGGSKHEPT